MRAPSAPATRRSASRSTLSAWRRSVLTAAAVSSARCHSSWCAVSATDTLNRWCNRSLRLFSTARLSLSDWQAARCSSQTITPTITGGSGAEGPGDLLDAIGLDQVTDLDVVEVLDADPALEALAHFADVVFEALERGQRPVVDLDPVADHAHAGGPRDDAAAHEAAGDGADFGDLEQLAHLRLAQDDFLALRGQQAFHGRLHLFP